MAPTVNCGYARTPIPELSLQRKLHHNSINLRGEFRALFDITTFNLPEGLFTQPDPKHQTLDRYCDNISSKKRHPTTKHKEYLDTFTRKEIN